MKKVKTKPLQDTDFLDFKCPYCGNTVSFPKAEAGKLKECPNCLEAMIVPKPPARLAAKILFPIQTPRLLLRRLRNPDWKDLFELVSDKELLRYLSWTPITGEEVEEWIARQKKVRFPLGDDRVNFAIEALESAKVIGLLDFWFPYEEREVAEFLIIIHPQFQRQGYGTEAVKGLLAYAFNGLEVRRMLAHCDTRNVPARGLLLKAGFRQEAEYIKDQFVKEEWVNTFGFALLREEFVKPI